MRLNTGDTLMDIVRAAVWIFLVMGFWGCDGRSGALAPRNNVDNGMPGGAGDETGSCPPAQRTDAAMTLQESQTPAPDGMVFVQGGCFTMGDVCGTGWPEERPAHTVCLDGFYMDTLEVRQAQYETTMGENPSYVTGCGDCPVENVTWFEADEYCRRTGKRLPTEAEWEYAARSGGADVLYATASGELSRDEANVGKENCCGGDDSDGHLYTAPAGSYPPNPLGLYDMSGNVWEWVSDWFDEDYYGAGPEQNPRGPDEGIMKTLRGGSWLMEPYVLRATDRTRHGSKDRYIDQGFRCAR